MKFYSFFLLFWPGGENRDCSILLPPVFKIGGVGLLYTIELIYPIFSFIKPLIPEFPAEEGGNFLTNYLFSPPKNQKAKN